MEKKVETNLWGGIASSPLRGNRTSYHVGFLAPAGLRLQVDFSLEIQGLK